MKRQFIPTALLLLSVFVAFSALQAQEQYDDLYYNPATDHEHFYGSTIDYGKSEKENKNLRNSDQEENGFAMSEDDNEKDEYFYSSRIRRFHRPNRYYHYDMWNSPWNYDPWYGSASISVYNNYYGNNWNRWNNWNNWNTPYCNSWNGGWGNSWNNGWGNNYYINNYYGNGWYGGNNWYPNYFGNNWNNPYYNNYGWNNGWNNNGWNNGWSNNNGWNNGNGSSNGGTKNPKGTHYGPRQTGGASTPAPPVRYGLESTNNGTTTGRTPRSNRNPDAVNNAKPEDVGKTPIRGRNTTTATEDGNDAANPNEQKATNGFKSRRTEMQVRENDTNNTPSPRRSEARSNESESRRYNPPARSNNSDESRSRSNNSSSDWNSSNRSSNNNNNSSNNSSSTRSNSSSNSSSGSSSGGGRRGRD